jgi:hypothetical protein
MFDTQLDYRLRPDDCSSHPTGRIILANQVLAAEMGCDQSFRAGNFGMGVVLAAVSGFLGRTRQIRHHK